MLTGNCSKFILIHFLFLCENVTNKLSFFGGGGEWREKRNSYLGLQIQVISLYQEYCYRTDPGGVNDILLPKGSPFFSGGPHLPTRFTLPAARERCLSMPETGEKERNY